MVLLGCIEQDKGTEALLEGLHVSEEFRLDGGALLMDFALVQAPAVNEGCSTFTHGMDPAGRPLFVYVSGSKVIILDGEYQLAQQLRTFQPASHIKAVAMHSRTLMIAAAYGHTVEIFAMIDDNDDLMHWRRISSIYVEFDVHSLDWNSNGQLAIGGAKVVVYEKSRFRDSREAVSPPETVNWVLLHSESLPIGSGIDRLSFSPDGRHLALFDSSKAELILKVITFNDMDQLDIFKEDLINLLGRPVYQHLEQKCFPLQSSFSFLRHDSPIAGFAWSPLTEYRNGQVLLTWTQDGMYTVWMPRFYDGLHGGFYLVRSFEAEAGWFEPGHPIRLNTLHDRQVSQFTIDNAENPFGKILEFRLSDCLPLSLKYRPWSVSTSIHRLCDLLLYLDRGKKSISLFELESKDDGTVTKEAFAWNYNSAPRFPIQMVSPYSMLAASVFPLTASTLNIYQLGAACTTAGEIRETFPGEILALQWVSNGHAFVSTSAGCFCVAFNEDPLMSRGAIKIHGEDSDVMQFVGYSSQAGLAVFWNRSTGLIQEFLVDYTRKSVEFKQEFLLDENDIGFIQLLDCEGGPHLVIGFGGLQLWRHYDLSVSCQPEVIYDTEDPIRLGRTSIFGDIALVSPRTNNTDALIIVTPTAYELHADRVFTEVIDTIIALKWVVVDHENFVRHLIVACTTGIVVYASSLGEEFRETWHRVDLTSFPESLSPPVPLGPATISCNKYLDIWVSLDDMIVMWAPVEESPVFGILRNALTPSFDTFDTSEFYTRLYSILLDPSGEGAYEDDDLFASARVPPVTSDLDGIARSTSPKNEDKYDFLFFQPETDSGLFSHDSSVVAGPSTTDGVISHVTSVTSLSKGLEILMVTKETSNIDGPGKKFLILNRMKGIKRSALDGLDYLCAFLSEAQESLINECVAATGSLEGWDAFCHVGLAYWVRNKERLGQIVESLCRHEYSSSPTSGSSVSLENISLFYILLGKRRALQALWKANSHDMSSSKIAQFLHQDFTKGPHRLVASKNAYASLSKQRYRLAIMFFLLADEVRDGILVAFDKLKDPVLAMVIARMTSNEGLLAELVAQGYAFPVYCQAILASMTGGTEDIIGHAFELARAAPWNETVAVLPILSFLKPPVRHKLLELEAERSMQILLRQGAFDMASTLIGQIESSVTCHLSLLRLTSAMIRRRWHYLKHEYLPLS